MYMSNSLTFYDRKRIEYYLNFKSLSLRRIAELVGRNHSVIVRELKRNKSLYFPYNAELAEKASQRRLAHNTKRKLDKNKDLYDFVKTKLKKDWSPEQIAGRLKGYPPKSLAGKRICAETIYQYIYRQDHKCEEYLYHYLRRAKPKRVKQGKRKSKKIIIPDRVSIHTRPETIDEKLEYGHWETDSMFCKGRKPLSVQYERKSMFTRIHKLTSQKAEDTNEAITKTIDSLPLYFVKTITFDNGFENTKHVKLKDNFSIKTYFCDPYSSWQKGGVENTNGLIRQYLPRKIDLAKVTEKQIQIIQEKLNNRPRKSLNYQTPNEIIKTQT